MVISGINPGPNTGVSVYYSGTIAAAREALLYHVPAFAVSVADFHVRDFGVYGRLAAQVVRKLYRSVDGKEYFYNINLPVIPPRIKGVRITHQSHSRFEENFIPVGKGKFLGKDYILRGRIELLKKTGLSDEEAVREGCVSITPCQLDISAYPEIERLERIFVPARRKAAGNKAKSKPIR
jgi:5'-nucleotidase